VYNCTCLCYTRLPKHDFLLHTVNLLIVSKRIADFHGIKNGKLANYKSNVFVIGLAVLSVFRPTTANATCDPSINKTLPSTGPLQHNYS